MAGEVTNRIIDELVSKGYDKATRDVDRYASSQDNLARTQQRVKRQTDSLLKQSQMRARSNLGFAADSGPQFRNFDAQRRLSRGTLERLETRRRASTPLPATTSGSGRLSAGSVFAGSLAERAFSEAISGVGRLAKASIAAAGATDRWKAQYNAVTTHYEESVTKLKESIGNVLMPTFIRITKDLGDAASEWALLADPKKMRAIWKDAGESAEAQIRAFKKARELGLPFTTGYGTTVLGRGKPSAPGIKIEEDRVANSRADMQKRMKAAEEEKERVREAMRERQFQRNIQIERYNEMTRRQPSAIRDLQRYVVGGGSRAGVGVTPVELAAGRGMGARSRPLDVRVKFDSATLSPVERAMGEALANLLGPAIQSLIRQGVIQPGN